MEFFFGGVEGQVADENRGRNGRLLLGSSSTHASSLYGHTRPLKEGTAEHHARGPFLFRSACRTGGVSRRRRPLQAPLRVPVLRPCVRVRREHAGDPPTPSPRARRASTAPDSARLPDRVDARPGSPPRRRPASCLRPRCRARRSARRAHRRAGRARGPACRRRGRASMCARHARWETAGAETTSTPILSQGGEKCQTPRGMLGRRGVAPHVMRRGMWIANCVRRLTNRPDLR